MFRVEKEDGFEGWAFRSLEEVLACVRLRTPYSNSNPYPYT